MFGGSGAVVGVRREGHAGGYAIIAGIDAVSDGSSLRGSGVFFLAIKDAYVTAVKNAGVSGTAFT